MAPSGAVTDPTYGLWLLVPCQKGKLDGVLNAECEFSGNAITANKPSHSLVSHPHDEALLESWGAVQKEISCFGWAELSGEQAGYGFDDGGVHIVIASQRQNRRCCRHAFCNGAAFC